MNLKSTKYLAIVIITFAILFLMNYIGNPATDKLSRALLTATAGAVGLTVGLLIMNWAKKDKTNHDLD